MINISSATVYLFYVPPPLFVLFSGPNQGNMKEGSKHKTILNLVMIMIYSPSMVSNATQISETEEKKNKTKKLKVCNNKKYKKKA